MKVIIKNLQKKIPIAPEKIKKAILKTLSLENRKKAGEITVLFVNDKQMREFNLMYSGRGCPTDVLSFDNSISKKEILADIAVSTDTAIRNAKIFKTTPLYEVYLYVIHGILHLIGYDDRTGKERKIMQEKADNILSILNADFRKSNADSRR